jgi:hypothetical protein
MNLDDLEVRVIPGATIARCKRCGTVWDITRSSPLATMLDRCVPHLRLCSTITELPA